MLPTYDPPPEDQCPRGGDHQPGTPTTEQGRTVTRCTKCGTVVR